jgi:glycosyltransferase involved in cell wall biosynthesis
MRRGRPLRVLFWSDRYRPCAGAEEIFASRLVASIRPRNVEFLVLASHHDDALPDEDLCDGVTIRRLPFRAATEQHDVKAFVRAIRETAAIKRDFAPDLIHMHGIGPGALFHLRTADASAAPLIVTLQEETLPPKGSMQAAAAAILDSAQWVVACSQTVLDAVRAAHPGIANRSSRIYNGFDPPPLEPAPPAEPPHLVAVGPLIAAKGFDLALRAFARIGAQFPAARLTIAGDGEAREELDLLAHRLGVAGRVEIRGEPDPDQLPSLLSEATVVVVPSRREALPLVAAQAALLARPIAAAAVGGLPELVIDGRTGFMTPPENAEALADALARLLADPDEAAAMGERGRVHLLTTFAWERTVASYHARYVAVTGISGGIPALEL